MSSKINKNYKAGIYCRLSRDDNNRNIESMSISNQKKILLDYVNQRGWNLVEIYVDDGYTGTNFERPDFKRMIRDIENGTIDCVITKDLSRLGRNYSMTGYYTDEYFPEQNVRFIAINDSVDTMGENNDFAAFHNVINEYYPKDISKKVRQVKKTNSQKGLFMGSAAPYGYKKSIKNKHVFEIDEMSANIVRRIFNEFISGYSARLIAERLNQDQIVCPTIYKYQSSRKDIPTKYLNCVWGSATVLSILGNQAYIGNMVQGKRQVVSFKSKKRRVISPEDWITVENTHEPIVERTIWGRAQELKAANRTRKSKDENTESIFAGIVHCADCGSVMTASKHGSSEKLSYRCSRYTNFGKSACSTHCIREEILEEVVLQDVRRYAALADRDRTSLINSLIKFVEKEKNREYENANSQLKLIQTKKEETSNIIKNLYKDKLEGKIPESIFLTLMPEYEQELKKLDNQIKALEQKQKAHNDNKQSVEQWVNLIHTYLSFEKLTRSLARFLIKDIIVSDKKIVDGVKTQDISIIYNFVGNISEFKQNKKDAA